MDHSKNDLLYISIFINDLCLSIVSMHFEKDLVGSFQITLLGLDEALPQ